MIESRMNASTVSCSGVTCASGDAATIRPLEALLIRRRSGPPSSETRAIAQRPNVRPSTVSCPEQRDAVVARVLADRLVEPAHRRFLALEHLRERVLGDHERTGHAEPLVVPCARW